MYCQLGATVYDGLKSFTSFSQDGDVVLVEHALIGVKPRLQPSGLNLETTTLTLFLHQEYCIVEEEIAKLINSRDTFEILPLLWGNGKVEGNFVIKQITRDKAQQDDLGNTYAAAVTVVLKECVNDNKLDQAQLDAQKNAFATGKKKPATKSARVNSPSCPRQISLSVSRIRNAGGAVNTELSKVPRSGRAVILCDKIIGDCGVLIEATNTTGNCVFGNLDIRSAANNVMSEAQNLSHDIADFQVQLSVVKSENTLLQSGINALVTAATPITQQAIVP